MFILKTAKLTSFKFAMQSCVRIWGCVNLIEIDTVYIHTVVIEIQGVENGDLVVPVNNTLMCRMYFLAADT